MTCPICGQKPLNCDCTEAERRMYAEIEELQDQVPRWIPVSERLPEDGQRVLAMTAERVLTVAWIHRERMGDLVWVTLDDVYDVEATHWMPLPEPPAN